MAKAKFSIVSPITGQAHTRRSLRPYLFAVVHFDPTTTLVNRYTATAEHYDVMAAQYRETAAHLSAGTTPGAGSVLLGRAQSWSYNSQKAGVKTIWDLVMFSRNVEGFIYDYAEGAAGYDASAAASRNRAAQIQADSETKETATFHHTKALAEAAAQSTHATRAVVVPITSVGTRLAVGGAA